LLQVTLRRTSEVLWGTAVHPSINSSIHVSST